jgi:hypothetical protein
MRYLHFPVRLAHTLPIVIALGLVATNVQATVLSYNISTLNSYIRERNANGLPVVTDTRTSLSGQIAVDTANGQLVSATIGLTDYSEIYDYDGPFGNADYAVLNYSGETQNFSGGVTGVLDGTVISFSGANQWAASSVDGGVSCSDSAGTNGNALCGSPSLEPWGPFDIDLLFSNDFSSFIASTTWSGPGTGGTTEDFHQLDIQGVREVPLPATVWLVMSGLLGLVVGKRRQRATKI